MGFAITDGVESGRRMACPLAVMLAPLASSVIDAAMTKLWQDSSASPVMSGEKYAFN